jgi:GntR family transcriptional regulator/MocR family aminotransferase
MSARLGIARNTVIQAYEQLLAEGCIESRRGSGHFVGSILPIQTLRSGQTGNNLRPKQAAKPAHFNQDFSFMHPQFRTAIPVRPFRTNLPSLEPEDLRPWIRVQMQVLRDAARYRSHARLMGESDAIGELQLRQAIVEHISLSRGVRCSPDQVIVTAGAMHAMDLLLRVIAHPGEQAWIEDPCFLGSLAALQGAGLDPVPVSVDSEGLDIAQGRRLAPNASLAIICPSKQYPLGSIMSLQRRLALIEWASQAGAWIIEDDYDSEYRYWGKSIPSLHWLDGGDNVIYIGTFSKVLFPALRIGFIVAPPGLVDPLVGARALSGRHGNAIEQQVLARFIGEGHLGRHIRRMRRLYKTRMEALLHHAKRELSGMLRVETADSGLQTIAWLNIGVDDRSVHRAGLQEGLELSPLSRYCIHNKIPPGLVLGFGAFPEEEIAEAVLKMRRVLEKQPALSQTFQ